MGRVHRFGVQGLAVQPPTVEPLPAGPVTPADQAADPVAELLRSLRGHRVVLQVGGVRREGKLVSVDPVILVGADGTATLVRREAILAVEF